MKQSKTAWGIILVCVGILVILMNMNVIGPSVIGAAQALWPLFIVAIGVTIMFKHSVWVHVVTWLALFATIIYFGLFGSQYDFIADHESWFSFNDSGVIRDSTTHSIKPDNQTTDTYTFELVVGGGSLIVREGESALVKADYPEDTASLVQENDNTLVLTAHDKGASFFGGAEAIYDIELDKSVNWQLNIKAGAVDALLNLQTLKCEYLDLDVGAASVDVTLGNMVDKPTINIDAAASDIYLEIPQDMGIKVISSSLLNDISIAGGSTEDDGTHYSDNFDASAPHVTVYIEGLVTSLRIVKLKP